MESARGTSVGRSEFKFVAKLERGRITFLPTVYEASVPETVTGAIARFLRSDGEHFSGYVHDRERRIAIRLSRMDRTTDTQKCSVELRTGSRFFRLTLREHEIATDVALGLSNARIAEIRNCSIRTVEAHVNNICRKLRVENRIGVAALIAGISGWLLPLSDTTAMSAHLLSVLPADAQHVGDSDPLPQSEDFKNQPVLIGTLYPMGVERLNDRNAMTLGAELAVQEINESHALLGGRPLGLVHPSGIAKTPRESLDELIDAGADGLIIGNQPVEIARDLLSIASRSGIPTMHSMVDVSLSPFVEDDTRSTNIFQMCADETVYLKAFRAFLTSQYAQENYDFQRKRIAVIQRSPEELPHKFNEILHQLKGDGWHVARTITYDDEHVNWPGVALEIYQSDVEAVYIGSYIEDGLLSLLTCLERIPKQPVLFSTWVPGIPGFTERAGALAEGLIWCTLAGNSPDFFGSSFDHRFVERYRRSPGIGSAAVHFDMVKFMVSAWNAAGGTIDREEVQRAMGSMVYRGAAGSYFFDHGLRRALCYPFDTTDQSVGQFCLTYRIEDGENVFIPFDGLRKNDA